MNKEQAQMVRALIEELGAAFKAALLKEDFQLSGRIDARLHDLEEELQGLEQRARAKANPKESLVSKSGRNLYASMTGRAVEDGDVDMVGLSIALSREAHVHQRYGDKDYFEYHVKGVARAAERITSVDVAFTLQVAYLHDAIEDSGLTLEDLRRLNFDDQVVKAVELLTKTKSSSEYSKIEIDEYLYHISRDVFARTVKWCDLNFNMANSLSDEQFHRAAKYQNQFRTLQTFIECNDMALLSEGEKTCSK